MARLTDEQRRHRCEVRQVLRWRTEHGRAYVGRYLAQVAACRGRERGEQLAFDCVEQWNLGNRGAGDDWRYPPRDAPRGAPRELKP